MHDLKKNRRKMMNKNMDQVAASLNNDEILSDMSRGCGSKVGECCKSSKGCTCSCNHCEPCQIDSDDCFENNCGPDCCRPISQKIPSISQTVPYVIETDRVYDTMQFKTFTDAQAPGGEPLTYIYEIIEVNGPLPKGGQVSVNIDKICINYESISINPGVTTLEDYDLDASCKKNRGRCDTTFDYDVCGERDSNCCSKGKGTSVVYKEKCLTVTVEGLVLELSGKCGCTTFKVLAYPAHKCYKSGHVERLDKIEFVYNTLSAPICLPADGTSLTLRQDFRVNLTVDCIGKAIIRFIECEGCECYYEFCIPNEIDVVLCLQNIVSTLVSEQIVVLGSPTGVEPREVDTFSKVCDFSRCGDDNL